MLSATHSQNLMSSDEPSNSSCVSIVAACVEVPDLAAAYVEVPEEAAAVAVTSHSDLRYSAADSQDFPRSQEGGSTEPPLTRNQKRKKRAAVLKQKIQEERLLADTHSCSSDGAHLQEPRHHDVREVLPNLDVVKHIVPELGGQRFISSMAAATENHAVTKSTCFFGGVSRSFDPMPFLEIHDAASLRAVCTRHAETLAQLTGDISSEVTLAGIRSPLHRREAVLLVEKALEIVGGDGVAWVSRFHLIEALVVIVSEVTSMSLEGPFLRDINVLSKLEAVPRFEDAGKVDFPHFMLLLAVHTSPRVMHRQPFLNLEGPLCRVRMPLKEWRLYTGLLCLNSDLCVTGGLTMEDGVTYLAEAP